MQVACQTRNLKYGDMEQVIADFVHEHMYKFRGK